MTPSPISRRTLMRLAAAGAAAAGLAGCGGGESSKVATPGDVGAVPTGAPDLSGVTLRWAVQADATQSLLEASGQLANLPYRIEWSKFAFGPVIVEALGADKVDLGLAGSTPPIFGAVAQTNFRVIATTAFRSKVGAAILVPESSPIREIGDLKGKKVGVPKASNAHGLLLTVLHRAGLGPNDAEAVFLPPPDALTAFGRGDVDAVSLFEPYITLAKQKGARVVAGGPPDEVGHVFEIASTGALNNPAKRAAITDAMSRLRIALEWGNQHPEEFAQAWSKESTLPLDVVRTSMPAMLRDVVPFDDAALAAQQTLADRLFEDRVIPEKVDFSVVVERGLLQPAPSASPIPS
ncbi:MAG: aliphatic sulfonate ABC transporter substrate-binding protein [Sporichthyaceae bacterium]